MRATSGTARRRSKNRLFKRAKGFCGGRRRLLRSVKETIIRADAYATRDRRVRKRDFRRLWITRISAAVKMRGLRYSEFVHGLKTANITLDRKSLSQIAIHDPAAFDAVCELVRKQLGNK